MIEHSTNSKTVLLVGGDDIALRGSLAKELQDRGWLVSMLGSKQPDPMPEAVTDYFHYDLPREFSISGDIKAIFQLRKFLRGHTFDLIHVFDTKPCIFAPLAALGTNHEIVRTVTGLGRIFVDDTLTNRTLRKIFSICHRALRPMIGTTVFYNQWDLAYFVNNRLIDADDGIVIPGSGIDATRFNPRDYQPALRREIRNDLELQSDRISCICVAKLEQRKGVPEYIEAARICSERKLPVDFVLVGPLVRETETLNYQTLANAKGICYLGERSDVENILAVTDIMVLPTRYSEGIPRVLTEAASMGLALIASDQPGCRAVIDHGENGYLLEPGTAEQIADHVQKLVEQPALLENARNQSLAKAPQFTLTAIAENLVATYESALANRSPK